MQRWSKEGHNGSGNMDFGIRSVFGLLVYFTQVLIESAVILTGTGTALLACAHVSFFPTYWYVY